MKIRNPYYMLWNDALNSMKDKNPKMSKDELKWESLFFNSVIDSGNIITVILWVKFFTNAENYSIELGIAPSGTVIEKLLSFSAIYIPILAINYLLIFYNNRCEKILTKYPDYKGKIIVPYIFGSIAIFILSALIIAILR